MEERRLWWDDGKGGKEKGNGWKRKYYGRRRKDKDKRIGRY